MSGRRLSGDAERRTVLITGASAGIGAALAEVFAAKGWDLILTARREAALQTLAAGLAAKHGVRAEAVAADLADPDGVDGLMRAMAMLDVSVDGLVNNAGFSRTSGFLNTDPADHAAMVRVMLAAPLELTRALAPGMVQRGFGRILNVASLAGLMPATGGDTLYGPIKSFLIKASAGLHLELARTGVHVTALCPGYTLTEFHDANGTRDEVSAAYPKWMWQTADQVARAGYDGVTANRARVIPGWRNRMLATLPKLLPDDLALRITAGHARRLARL